MDTKKNTFLQKVTRLKIHRNLVKADIFGSFSRNFVFIFIGCEEWRVRRHADLMCKKLCEWTQCYPGFNGVGYTAHTVHQNTNVSLIILYEHPWTERVVIPPIATRLPWAGLMAGQRRRCCPAIQPAQSDCIVFAGMYVYDHLSPRGW